MRKVLTAICLVLLSTAAFGDGIIKTPVGASSPLSVGTVVRISGDRQVVACNEGEEAVGVIIALETYPSAPDSYLISSAGIASNIQCAVGIVAGDKVVPANLGRVQPQISDPDGHIIGTAMTSASAGGYINVLLNVGLAGAGGEDNQTIITGAGVAGAEGGTDGDLTIDLDLTSNGGLSFTGAGVSRTVGVNFGTGTNQAARGDHAHQTLTRGTGLTGSNYNGSTTATFAVDFGTGTNQAARGDHNHSGLYDNYGSWTATPADGGSAITVASGSNVIFDGTGGASVTRGSGNTITIDASGAGDGNDYVTGMSFNTGTGVLTLTHSALGSIPQSLDGRYLTSYNETDPTWTGTANTTGNISRTGNVSIGTTTSLAKLYVDGLGGTAVRGGLDGNCYGNLGTLSGTVRIGVDGYSSGSGNSQYALQGTAYNTGSSNYHIRGLSASAMSSTAFGYLTGVFADVNVNQGFRKSAISAILHDGSYTNSPPGDAAFYANADYTGGYAGYLMGGVVWVGDGGTASRADGDGDLFVKNDLEVEGGIELNGSYITSWPAGGTNYWTLSGSNLYPNSTTYNVGVGTTSPDQKMVVEQNHTGTTRYVLRNTNSAGEMIYAFSSAPSQYYAGMHLRNNYTEMRLYNNFDNGYITFNNNSGTERMRIENNGYVGIGTSVPTTQLHTTGGVRFAGISGTGNHLYIDASGNLSKTTISGGSSNWTDAGTYIRANDNATAMVYDNGQNWVFKAEHSTSSAGSNWGWGSEKSAVSGRSNGYGYQAGIYGYHWASADNSGAVVGAYTSGLWGGLAYRHAGTVYAGYFSGNVHITGNLTVDGTYPGGGASQWEDAGIYKRVVGNDNVRAYEAGQNYGLYGRTTASSTYNYGVYGQSSGSTNDYGVYGYASDGISGDWGVYGYNNYQTGFLSGQIIGLSGNWAGAYGDAYGSSSQRGTLGDSRGYGVWGSQGTGSYAGYFSGNVHITGNLTVDGTYPGGGGGLWTDAGSNIYANIASNFTVYQNTSSYVGLSFIYGTETNAITNWSNDGVSVLHCNNESGTTYGIDIYGGNYGVYAQGSTYAGYFDGNVHITGTLTGGGAGSSTWVDGGSYFYPTGNSYVRAYKIGNQYGLYGDASSGGANSSGIYGYAGSGTAGTGYGTFTSRTAVKGYAYYGYDYAFGVAGHSWGDYTRTGGVLGGSNYGSPPTAWGSLGYKNSGSTHYGAYWTSSSSGSGRPAPPRGDDDPAYDPGGVHINIGAGGYGDLFGLHAQGQIYGAYFEGGRYGLYTYGDRFSNGLDVHLTDVGEENMAVSYTTTSTEAKISADGVDRLSSGSRRVEFDSEFKKLIDPAKRVTVAVTPLGDCNGVHLAQVDENGFTVVENNGGSSEIEFMWIAMARRIDARPKTALPREVVAADYTDKVGRGLNNDANTRTNGKGLYFEGGELIVGTHTSVMPNENLIALKEEFDNDPLSRSYEEWASAFSAEGAVVPLSMQEYQDRVSALSAEQVDTDDEPEKPASIRVRKNHFNNIHY